MIEIATVIYFIVGGALLILTPQSKNRTEYLKNRMIPIAMIYMGFAFGIINILGVSFDTFSSISMNKEYLVLVSIVFIILLKIFKEKIVSIIVN